MRRAAIPILILLGALASGPLAAETVPPQTASLFSLVPKRVTAIDARLVGDERRTRLVVDLSRKIELTAFTLADPYRVVVDLPDVAFDLSPSVGRKGRGLVSAFRYGVFAPGKARIVIDAVAPVAIDKAFVLEESEDQPARLVIDLIPTERATFMRTAAIQWRSEPAGAPAATASIPARKEAIHGAPPVIVIDPGHGGVDSGAIAPSGHEEKAVVLAVALKLRERLERNGRFRVVLTRADDTFVPLNERLRHARESAASLFISIHADSISRHEGEARGATIYTVSDRASDAEAAKLADKENKADLIAGVDLSAQSNDVADILFDLAHRETRNFSSLFARTLVGRMSASVLMHKQPMKSAGFIVLRAPDIPSVLIELGYLSHPEDVKQLTSEGWRERVAVSIVEAIESFFANRRAGR